MQTVLRFAYSRRTCGFLVAFVFVLSMGELYLRFFPPKEFQTYLGESSPLTGPFTSHDVFGVQYRDWRSFESDYQDALKPYLPFGPPENQTPTWAMFGNSFVQATGMLADTTREQLPKIRVFNLGRNEPLIVRLAQIELLLENGFHPERIVIALLPLDFLSLYLHSLDQIQVNHGGAMTYRVRNPGGIIGWCLSHSRLVLTAWIRGKLHHAHPGFNPSRLSNGLTETVANDVRKLFERVHEVGEKHGVPITILLIPNYEQIVKGIGFGLQAQLLELFASIGIDVCDSREVFVSDSDKASLFIPDKHFSRRGNQLLLNELLRHPGFALTTSNEGR